jgi:hypothetical protein
MEERPINLLLRSSMTVRAGGGERAGSSPVAAPMSGSRLSRVKILGKGESGSGTLSRNRSLAGYTIDTRESEFSEGTLATWLSSVLIRSCYMMATSFRPIGAIC